MVKKQTKPSNKQDIKKKSNKKEHINENLISENECNRDLKLENQKAMKKSTHKVNKSQNKGAGELQFFLVWNDLEDLTLTTEVMVARLKYSYKVKKNSLNNTNHLYDYFIYESECLKREHHTYYGNKLASRGLKLDIDMNREKYNHPSLPIFDNEVLARAPDGHYRIYVWNKSECSESELTSNKVI